MLKTTGKGREEDVSWLENVVIVVIVVIVIIVVIVVVVVLVIGYWILDFPFSFSLKRFPPVH